MKTFAVVTSISAAAVAAIALSGPAFALDTAAAEKLARQEGCSKCHAVDKKKDGPPLREIAGKYKGKADGEETLMKHFVSGERVKLPDGSEEEHKIIKTKDPKQLKNLAQWILSL